MVGEEYTTCPICGGNDGQGCYGDCPSEEIPKLRAEIESLRKTRDELLRSLAERDYEIARLLSRIE